MDKEQLEALLKQVKEANEKHFEDFKKGLISKADLEKYFEDEFKKQLTEDQGTSSLQVEGEL